MPVLSRGRKINQRPRRALIILARRARMRAAGQNSSMPAPASCRQWPAHATRRTPYNASQPQLLAGPPAHQWSVRQYSQQHQNTVQLADTHLASSSCNGGGPHHPQQALPCASRRAPKRTFSAVRPRSAQLARFALATPGSVSSANTATCRYLATWRTRRIAEG